MKRAAILNILTTLLILIKGASAQTSLQSINPGRYDTTWWNRAPMRLIQTNLREIDANMDRDAYVKAMTDASASIVLLNVGGIVANYPTQLPYHYRNTLMKGDLVGDLVKKLHEKGIKVIARFDFSKLNETLATQKPEWLYVGTNGKNVNYNGQVHTCINGGYQQEYAFEILKEAITTYPLDGIFFNMIGYVTSDYSGNNYGICQCNNCKKRFLDSTGLKLPVTQNDPAIREYRVFQQKTSDELFNRIKNHIKKFNPKLLINNYTDAGAELIASESGSTMTTAVEWNYHASDNVKRVLGSYKDRMPSNLLINSPGYPYRHVGISPNLARIWMLGNMLNGASINFVVIGTLHEYEDRIFVPVLNDIYGFHKTNEKLFTNIESVSNIAVIKGPDAEYKGIFKILTEEHIPFDVILPDAVGSARAPKKLSDYKTIVLGDMSSMNEDLITKIDEYVKNGGNVLATGFTSTGGGEGNKIRLKSLGVMPDYEVYPQHDATYLRISEQDKAILGKDEMKDFTLMMMYSRFLKCKVKEGAYGYLKLVEGKMVGPPEKAYFTDADISGFPGVIAGTYGNGKSVFIPWQIGSQYNQKGNYAQRKLFIASLQNLLKFNRPIVTDASPLIEMSHMINRNDAFEWIGMINHSGQIGTSMREPVTIHNTSIRVKPQKTVKEIRLVRSGKTVPFKQNGNWIEYTVPQIEDFEMAVCFYK